MRMSHHTIFRWRFQEIKILPTGALLLESLRMCDRSNTTFTRYTVMSAQLSCWDAFKLIRWTNIAGSYPSHRIVLVWKWIMMGVHFGPAILANVIASTFQIVSAVGCCP